MISNLASHYTLVLEKTVGEYQGVPYILTTPCCENDLKDFIIATKWLHLGISNQKGVIHDYQQWRSPSSLMRVARGSVPAQRETWH
jgi:hypothetical protein